jgi:outer membrane immunogenic protein
VSGTHYGFTVGGGVEWAVSRDLSFQAEYHFADYDARDYPLVTTPDRISFATHTVRAGITWHFNRTELAPLK